MINISGENLIYNGYLLMNIYTSKNILVWRFVSIINNTLHLEGKDNFFMDKNDYFYYCILNDHIYYPKYYYYSGYDILTMFGNIERGRLVVFDVPLTDKNNLIRFFISYKTERIELLSSFGWFSKIPNTPNGYYNSGKYIIKINDYRFNIFKYNSTLIETFENKYCQDLKIIKRNEVIKIRNNFFKFNSKQKEIWIINDNLNIARGNGEYFFRYLIVKKPQNIEYYFVIKKISKDYERLKYLGNILEYGTEKYLDIFLKADKIISSISEEWVDNPFGNNYKYLKDLFNFKFIYIPNGIIKDDLSLYLNRIKKNYFLITTSLKKEYKSLLKDKYGYEINNIILTGMPKFDYLTQIKNKIKIQKIVLIMPNWRIYIKGTYDSKKYESVYSQTFKSTEFFKFYNTLINDKKLINFMDKLNYKGILCLHPNFSKHWKDFDNNKIFSVLEECDYQTLILESSLLITDYSNLFFDFAYLNKPIIYTHFDYEEYRNKQYQKGFFDYIKNGFGPVCFNLDCTINSIIIKLKNNCTNEHKYLKRINKLFLFKDEKNSERLYLNLINSSNDYKKVNEDNRFSKYILLFQFIILIIKIINDYFF